MRSLTRFTVLFVVLALVAGCAPKRFGPEKTRLAAALLVREAQLQFRQAAQIFDAFCDVPASTLSASEMAQCADWVKVVGQYKIAYPLALAAVQSPASLDLSDPATLDALLKVKNEIIRLLIFRGVEPAIVTPTLGSVCDPLEADEPQAPRACPRVVGAVDLDVCPAGKWTVWNLKTNELECINPVYSTPLITGERS